MSVVTWERDARALDGDIVLDGREVDVTVGSGLVSFDEELSMSGSSIVRVGVVDPERILIDSGVLDLRRDDAERLRREVELVVDGVVYWLRSVSKQLDTFELTFEDRTICRLRDRGSTLKAAKRADGHRGFIERMCELALVDPPVTRDPGPREREARAKSGMDRSKTRRERERAEADERRDPGIASNARLRVKTAWANAKQLEIASQLLAVATQLGASDKVMVSLIAVAIQESFLENDPSPDEYGSVGVLQGRVNYSNTHLRSKLTYAQAMDVAFNAETFLRDPGWASQDGAMRTDRLHPDWSIGRIGQQVERGPDPSAYDQWESQARAIVEAYKGGALSLGGGGGGGSRLREAPLTVNRGESYWDAAQRISESYGFRFFVVANQAYYLSDEALLNSRPRMVLGEDSAGVHTIDWEWAPRKSLRRTDIECNVRAWRAPPGSVVMLDDSCGPAAGRWLVGEYERSRFGPTAQITLVKGRKPVVPTVAVAQTTSGGRAPGAAEAVGTSGYVWPLAIRGEIGGGPGVGTHTPGSWPDNWQSDNAVDIHVAMGTAVLAVRAGTVVRAAGSWGGGGGQTDGFTVTLRTDDGRQWFYTHLMERVVNEGDKVAAGALLGKSGAGNSEPHLHIGVDSGNPMTLLGISR